MTRTVLPLLIATLIVWPAANVAIGQHVAVGPTYPAGHVGAFSQYSKLNDTPVRVSSNHVSSSGVSWPSAQSSIGTDTQSFQQPYGAAPNGVSYPPQTVGIDAITGCDTPACAGVDCAACCCSGFYGGFAFVWIRPRFDQNAALVIDPVAGNRVVPFSYDREITPRVWFGYQGATGSGVRMRYWDFDAAADTEVYSPTPAATPAFLFVYGASGNLARNAFADVGETMTSNHSLQLMTFDLEATQSFHWQTMNLLGGLGLRYVQMDQVGQAVVTDGVGGLVELVRNDHDFAGIGPTISLEMVRPLFSNRWALYGNLRGSILLGDGSQRITEIKNSGADVVLDTVDQDDILSIGEIEFGLQYSRPCRSGATWFVRVGYEGQIWWGAGGPTDTDSNMGLDGISLSLGLYR